jgi:hypothetical protein
LTYHQWNWVTGRDKNPMTEDNFASSILAGLLLIIMFSSMRAFYGCWPWEYRKTWYRTRKEIAHLNALMGPSRPPHRRPEPADTEEAPTMPDPIADALREKIAESMRWTPPSDDALRADRENEYPKQSTRFG